MLQSCTTAYANTTRKGLFPDALTVFPEGPFKSTIKPNKMLLSMLKKCFMNEVKDAK